MMRKCGDEIVRVMECFKNFKWLFLLIVLTDSVIGHVSDGTGGIRNNNNIMPAMTISTTPLSSSLPSSSSSSQPPVIAGQPTPPPFSPGNSDAKISSSSSSTSSSGSAGDSRLLEGGLRRNNNMPYIDKAASPNVTALLGKTAYLNCRVRNLGDKTVSWVRHRDIHLLSIGRFVYTTDQRFRALHIANTEDYTLMIKYAQHRDSGIYEAQVSTTPHLSHFVHLSVVEPVTEVIGGPELFIDRGSTINLTCTVKYSPEPPSYIIWNHNDAIISYNSPRGGVSVLTEKGETTTSYLLIQQAKPTDSGRYSCTPSNAAASSIFVQVLEGELPAAIQGSSSCQTHVRLEYCLVLVVLQLISLTVSPH